MNQNTISWNRMDWKISNSQELNNEDGRGTIYKNDALISFSTDSNGQPRKILIRHQEGDDAQFLPLFMGIDISNIVSNDSHTIVAIIGNHPCELHRLIIRFSFDENEEPIFDFEAIPVYESGACNKNGNNISTLMDFVSSHVKGHGVSQEVADVISAHGIGGGSGGGTST